jgi:hypothetical protein
VSQSIAAAYKRLDAAAPWNPTELLAGKQESEVVDREARRYMLGETAEPTGFLGALARWERALLGRKGRHASNGEGR